MRERTISPTTSPSPTSPSRPLSTAAFNLVSLTEGVLEMQRCYQCSDRVRDRLHEAEDHLKRALTALRVAERQALLG